MKRAHKWSFFVVVAVIAVLFYTAFFGVYKMYGDRQDTIIRGAKDIRWGTDIRGGVDATFGPTVDDLSSEDIAKLPSVQTIIEQRMILNNITDYEVYTDTSNQQIIVRFPWKTGADFDPAKAIAELGQTAQLAFYIGGPDADGKPQGDPILTGTDVNTASAMYQTDENGNVSPVIQLKLNDSGKQSFADATAKQYAANGTISIWLDEDLLSNPTVSAHITDGVAIISGMADYSEANRIANLITSGALPFAIEVKSFGTNEPTMGTAALNVMLIAGIIAFALIAIFLIAVYRLPGAIAVIALIGQITGSVMAVSGYFSFMDSFTLTISGIAGIILSIGMGVDANVITAERIKEELRGGRPIDAAIHNGYKSSLAAIVDGNVTNVIVAIVLMGVFGSSEGIFAKIFWLVLNWFPAATTGFIYSFGYTLLVGIITNFIFGVFASRTMLKSIVRFKGLRKPWLLGGDRA